MKKNIVQDVIPPKKSIRNVGLSSRTTSKIEETNEESFVRPILKREKVSIKREETKIIKETPSLPTPSYKYDYEEPVKPSKKGLYVAISLFVLVSAFGISALFKSAEIKFTPKNETKVLAETFKASKDAVGNTLGFQMVTISKDLEKTIDPSLATTVEQVFKKAQGKIVIYNRTAASQKLVVTTRFETPEGLIFRLLSPTTVPAMQIKDAKGKAVAGSIEVTVEADKPGTLYNVGLKDFTLPGLKGDPKYKEIYARSKTEMIGGFSGTQKVIPKNVLDNADKELEATLKSSLSKDIISQIPADFVLYQDSLSYKFESITQSSGPSGELVLKKKAQAFGIIFDKGSLTRAIATKVLPDTGGGMVKITNLPDLNFQFEGPTPSNLNTSVTVNFSLKGQPKFVWVFDENKLKSDLLGLSKKNAKTIIGTYAAIKEAWVLTRPFWNQNIPSDPKKVVLINTLTTQ